MPSALLIRIARLLVVMGLGAGGKVLLGQEDARAPDSPLPQSMVVAEQLFPALKPIMESAAQQSLRTVNANIEALIAEETRKMARASLLPAVSGYAQWSMAQDRLLGQPDPIDAEKMAYYFTLRQPVYHWGALKARHNIGKIGVKIAEKNAIEAYRLLMLEVRNAYLHMVLQKAVVTRARLVFKQIEDEVKVAESRLAAGTLAPAERFGIELRLEQGRADLDTKEETYRMARLTLERLAGIPPIADEDIPALVDVVPYSAEDVSSLVQRFIATDAVNETSAVASAQMRLDQEKLNYRIIATNLRPKLSFETGSSQDEVSYTGRRADRARIQTIYAGIRVEWFVFDGFSTSAQKRASKLRMRQLEAEREERARQQLDLIKNQARQLDFAFRKTQHSEKLLGASNSYVTAMETNVKRGVATAREFEAAKLSRDEAVISAMFYRIDYLSKLSEFLSAIGRDPALLTFSLSSP